jgi:ACT domain-containing protein
MIKDEIILRHRINLLLKGQSIKNISDAYRQEGYSQSSYYKYRARYVKYGTQGLKDKQRGAPVMQNATRGDVVAKVLDIAKRYPAYGPARLTNELDHVVVLQQSITS